MWVKRQGDSVYNQNLTLLIWNEKWLRCKPSSKLNSHQSRRPKNPLRFTTPTPSRCMTPRIWPVTNAKLVLSNPVSKSDYTKPLSLFLDHQFNAAPGDLILQAQKRRRGWKQRLGEITIQSGPILSWVLNYFRIEELSRVRVALKAASFRVMTFHV